VFYTNGQETLAVFTVLAHLGQMLMTVMTQVLQDSIIKLHIVRYWAVLGVAVRSAVRAVRTGLILRLLWIRSYLVAVVRSQPLIDFNIG
jgi:hypothetical protein